MEVGEYIRTEKGIISKINSGVDIDMLEFENAIIGNIKSHSKNIIDLVEENDYVNGNKVVSINGELYVKDEGALSDIIIKDVVTHEYFEKGKYRV